MKIKILLTGASGFVGSNITNFMSNKPQFEIIPASLRGSIQPDLFKDANVVIHLAGKAHDLKKSSDDNEYFTVNTELTKKLFDFFLNSAANDFIYFSSVKAAADTVDGVLT
jgi:nucleoside-diphosphate-sugar epimerase